MGRFTATVPLSYLSTKQAVRHLITCVIPTMQEEIIMALNAALTRLSAEVQTQLEQTAEAIGRVQAAVDALAASEAEKAALQAELDALRAANDAAVEAINAQADALAADNPDEEPDPDPEPEPVDPEPEVPADPEGGDEGEGYTSGV